MDFLNSKPEKTADKLLPVVMAADNNYAYPMTVAAASLLNTAGPDTAYEVYLLVSENFTLENRRYIEQIFSASPKCSCKFMEMHQAYENANIHIPHTTHATYYRLMLPSLLPDVRKCIYLDVDIVVKKDLSSLFFRDMDDIYIAGVRALSYFSSEKEIKRRKAKLGLDSFDNYINAGVLLMNLDKMRRDRLEIKFNELLNKNLPSQDQDILNVACADGIRRLPFKYNAMTKYPLLNNQAYDSSYLNKWIEKEEWDDGRKNPVIIHYADKIKPWNDLSAVYAHDWWDAVKTLPDELAEKITRYYSPGMGQTGEKKIKKINVQKIFLKKFF